MGSAISQVNFADLNLIYNEKFTFSLPRKTLEDQLSGVAFDNKVPYTEEEKKAGLADLQAICSSLFEGLVVTENKEVVMTAGAPGAGKTVLMESMLAKANEAFKRFAYIDPDAVCLKNQKETYLKDVNPGQSKEERKVAYDKWRPLSNFITNVALAHLIKSGASFYYGTTASSPFTKNFMGFLEKQGYKDITVVSVTASNETRVKAVHLRDKNFVQTTDDDIRNKGDLFAQRTEDTFPKLSSKTLLYFRKEPDEEAVLAATWERKEEGKGELSIHDRGLYDEIAKVHDEVLARLGNDGFKKTLEAVSLKAR